MRREAAGRDKESRMRALVTPLLIAAVLLASACASRTPDTLKKVKESGSLAIGYRESSVPFSFVNTQKQPSGYSVELCKRIAASIQQQLALPNLQIKWVPVTPEDRITSVANGTVDIECGSTTNTLARQEQVDFTNMTFVDGSSLLVTATSGIRRVADVAGKRVAVIPGTTTEGALSAAMKKAGVTAQIIPVKEHIEGLKLLDQGGADAYASDRVLLIGLAIQSGDITKLRLADEYLSYEPYGFMVRRNDANFRLAANRALARIYRSEEIDRLYETWFGALGTPSALLQAMYILNGLPE
jgi:ABC-type amino acid transport substrate-binding protein